ncbi:hypothetical protein V5D56_01995 [Cellulosimicrobium sp. PMB13]|uniref:hypothetical protein n=1 Tax=Cellulosimicrobium sp. PMB13 TaxID=3120158 RepID=UPI003F4B784C
MNDPLERLRAQAGEGDDRFDGDAVLDEVRRRTDGVAPGDVARRRRLVRAASGVAGVGAVVAVALVVPTLVVPGGPSREGAALALRDGVVRDGVVRDEDFPSGPSTDGPTAGGTDATGGTGAQGASVIPAVAYAERARSAVETIDLASLVLEVRSTHGVQHPGDAGVDPGTIVEYVAGDGSVSRWISVEEPESWIGTSGEGMEEVHHVDPDGPPGQMTYWWVSAPAGVYTRFTLPPENWDEIQEGTVPEQLATRLDELRSLTDEIEQIAAQEDVTVGAPTATTVAGRDATCFDLTGQEAPVIDGVPDGAWPGDELVEWTRHACFDDATDLPILDRNDVVYQLPDRTEPSFSSTTTEYAWLPLDDTSRALLQPGIDGLREVDKDTFVELTG